MKVTTINRNQLKIAEHANIHYAADIPAGVKLEEALKPEYWVHVQKQMKVWDRIDLRAQDRSFYAECIVLQGFPSFKLEVLTKKQLKKPAAQSKEFKIEYVDEKIKFRVVRNSDNHTVSEGHESEELANNWLKAKKAS